MPKHVAQRSCVACHRVTDKSELIRIVRVPDGSIEVDTAGRKPGRGAYLCRTRECWEAGCKGKQIDHALRTTLSRENREQLLKFSQEFSKE